VIVDNNLSALIRITASLIVKEPLLTMPVASSLPIRSIFLRYLHPPAGAVAPIVVIGQVSHYQYALFPVMVDSALLVIAGAIYSNSTGKISKKA
jgi:CBS domain-containing membrane protein